MLEETGTPAESPLPPAILRGLGDRSYDKRKTAALDVTALIKSLQEGGTELLQAEGSEFLIMKNWLISVTFPMVTLV